MERVILHSDLNNFYASVECLYHPDIRNHPVAVGGSSENRHGIVLAKNDIAKAAGVKTGEALWQARQKCPDILFVPPNFELYRRFSTMAREIYSEYTNQVESFGLDECWLDVTGCTSPGGGHALADQIRERLKSDLGITASVGVSFNKIFSKLGSDMKKPNATTEISRENFRTKIWPLPVNDLLYVGRATYKKFQSYGIRTIGELANTEKNFLKQTFGKNGVMLWCFANGMDSSPVLDIQESHPVKSIGNSITAPRDLVNDRDAKIILYALCESVAARLREQNFRCRTVQISIRDNNLFSFDRQGSLKQPSSLSGELFSRSLALYQEHVRPDIPIRSLGVRACNLEPDGDCQLSFFPDMISLQKQEALERSVDGIKRRFGNFALQRGIMLTDPKLSGLNPKEEHTIHPVGLLHEKVENRLLR